VLQQTAKWLFALPESPLSPILNSGMVDSPLLTLPIYRQAVFSALVDTKVVGTATRSPEGLASYCASNRSGGAPAEPGRDARVPHERGCPVRVKDLVALALSSLTISDAIRRAGMPILSVDTLSGCLPMAFQTNTSVRRNRRSQLCVRGHSRPNPELLNYIFTADTGCTQEFVIAPGQRTVTITKGTKAAVIRADSGRWLVWTEDGSIRAWVSAGSSPIQSAK